MEDSTTDPILDTDAIPMEMDLTTNGPPPPDDDETPSRRPSKFDRFCSATGRYARRVLPHIGLVLLLGVYTVCGAGIFHVVELPYEIDERHKTMDDIYKQRDYMLQKMYNDSMSNRDILFDEWREGNMEALDNFTRAVYRAYKIEYVTAEDIVKNRSVMMWTFPQAIFFATTVITTIGYGNMVPRTIAGRILCIVFGLFGIPLLLITIADIGKFCSDFMNFSYHSYTRFKRHLRRKSKLLTFRRSSKAAKKQESVNLAETVPASNNEIRLPVVLVMLVVLSYTAIGGALFRALEGWDYFDAFYFCFITMATIGFGDIVPSKQTYMFITIAYIVIGLALTTMCIDLAGTEYIQKIHSFGQKIETAKDMMGVAVVSGWHAGEHLLKNTGYTFIKTAGGKLVRVPHSMFLSSRHHARYPYEGSIVIPEGVSEEEFLRANPEVGVRRRYGMIDPLHQNILFSPISPEVEKLLKPHIKIRPEEIKESDAYILKNKTFNRPVADGPTPAMMAAAQQSVTRSRSSRLRGIRHRLRAHSWPRKIADDSVLFLAPFILKESKV